MSLGDNIRACHNCGTKKYQLPILDEAPDGDKVIMCVDYTAPLLPPSERNNTSLYMEGIVSAVRRCGES